MGRFEGRAALVVGASSGIGLAAARRIAEEGGVIVGVARDEARLEAALAALPGSGHRAIRADATIWAQMEPLAAVGKGLGGYAAGVFCAGAHEMRPLSLLDADVLRGSFDANVVSAVHALRVIARASRREGAGVVCVSSMAALRATAGFAAYSAAKGALISAARVAAVELASRKVRVNVIAAGVVDTPMSERWLGLLTPEQREAVGKRHLLGVGRPEDVASVAAFLASDDARWMTGAVVVADGGLSVG